MEREMDGLNQAPLVLFENLHLREGGGALETMTRKQDYV